MIGSINIGLGGSYATWAGTLLDHETPIVIIAEPGTESEAAAQLHRRLAPADVELVDRRQVFGSQVVDVRARPCEGVEQDGFEIAPRVVLLDLVFERLHLRLPRR